MRQAGNCYSGEGKNLGLPGIMKGVALRLGPLTAFAGPRTLYPVSVSAHVQGTFIMPPTSASLLQRLRTPGSGPAWDEFVELYSPLLFQWARRAGLKGEDAADLVQEVFVLLVRKLPEFEYDPSKGF